MLNIRKPLSAARKMYESRPGFHTERKILIIESDDWGSIRMPSRDVYEKLLAQGDPVDRDAFLRNDALESPEDLEALFSTLRKYTDKNGNHPCVTANFAVANPDFDAIDPRQARYAYEIFTDTYERYSYPKDTMTEMIREGTGQHLFRPQLHAREHMNVARWMDALRNEAPDAVLAFRNHMIGTGTSFRKDNHFGYMDALNYDSKEELRQLAGILKDAADIFEEVFGYRSATFVASCFVWTSAIEKILFDLGIRSIQTQFRQNICPLRGTSLMIRPYHYTGQKNRLGQYYTLRNCEYEPGYDHLYEERARKCLAQIENAFGQKKPAIINSHRMNYIGGIDPENRDTGLKGLELILSGVCSKYPEIEFMSSDELLETIMPENER